MTIESYITKRMHGGTRWRRADRRRGDAVPRMRRRCSADATTTRTAKKYALELRRMNGSRAAWKEICRRAGNCSRTKNMVRCWHAAIRLYAMKNAWKTQRPRYAHFKAPRINFIVQTCICIPEKNSFNIRKSANLVGFKNMGKPINLITFSS